MHHLLICFEIVINLSAFTTLELDFPTPEYQKGMADNEIPMTAMKREEKAINCGAVPG